MTLSHTHTKATSSLTLSYRARANALLCFPQQERENNAVYYSRTNFLFLGKSDERDRTNEIKTRANFNAREERAEREREREREGVEPHKTRRRRRRKENINAIIQRRRRGRARPPRVRTSLPFGRFGDRGTTEHLAANASRAQAPTESVYENSATVSVRDRTAD